MYFDPLRNELVGNYSNLSRRLQQITRYAMSNPYEMALETIVISQKGQMYLRQV